MSCLQKIKNIKKNSKKKIHLIESSDVDLAIRVRGEIIINECLRLRTI